MIRVIGSMIGLIENMVNRIGSGSVNEWRFKQW